MLVVGFGFAEFCFSCFLVDGDIGRKKKQRRATFRHVSDYIARYRCLRVNHPAY